MRYFKSESGVGHWLRTDKASSCTNTASDSLRELVEGFILQLRIESYSPRIISYYNDYVNNFASDLPPPQIDPGKVLELDRVEGLIITDNELTGGEFIV
jgi:hypothetical protein